MVSVGVWSAEVGFCRPEGNQTHFTHYSFEKCDILPFFRLKNVILWLTLYKKKRSFK